MSKIETKQDEKNGIVLYPSPLINKSVCCWLNSVIQAICSNPEFNKMILSDVGNNLTNTLFRLMYSFINMNIHGLDTINCSVEILEAVNKINRESMSNIKMNQKQQCALEFFENLLELMKNDKIINLFKMIYLRQTTCPKCNKTSTNQEEMVYRNIYKTHNVAHFNENSRASKNLLDLLGHKENISMWKCPSCMTDSPNVTSIYRICRLPEIIVLSFNKTIDNSNVYLDRNMTIRSKTSGNETKYTLKSTIHHYGTSESGHYICNGLRKSGQSESWYVFDDQKFSEIQDVTLESGDIYLAFYSRV